jgi:hypothetical protein
VLPAEAEQQDKLKAWIVTALPRTTP